MDFDFQNIPTVNIPISKLEENKGQIEGVPRNPRVVKDANFKKLVKSIQEDTEFLSLNCLHVFQQGKKYVVCNGNMRLKACRELGLKVVPCKVIPPDTSTEKLKRYIMKDNIDAGEWDWGAIHEEWDAAQLDDWGVDVPEWGTVENEVEGKKGTKENIEEVEQMLAEAMRRNVIEFVEQIDVAQQNGFLITGLTKGLCEAKFIRAKYYGERYPQKLAACFTPEIFYTSANTISVYEQLKRIKNSDKDNAVDIAGIAGLRTVCYDGELTMLLKSSYPIGGSRMPLDFPSDLARQLINEFSNGRHADILDPCHGWGGRLIGALLADVASYTGVDPSEEAHKGVGKIVETLGKYSPETKCTLIKGCFEEVELQDKSFDIAITSPPYFDVEQYHGEEQAHVKYPKYDIWVDKFYTPLIERTYHALRDGGVFVLQVGSQRYPLKNDAERIANSIGFKVEEIRPFGRQTNGNLHGNTDETEENEKIMILRKEARP